MWIGNYSFRKYSSLSFLSSYLIKHPGGSKPWCTDTKKESHQPSPLLSFCIQPPDPSTCRPPLCHWEGHRLRPKPSAPGASGSVHWGPASQSASVDGPSWWCLSVPGCRPQPPRRSTSPWDQKGPGCGRPPAKPEKALKGSVEVGIGVSRPRSVSLPLRSPLGSPMWTCLVSRPLDFPVHPRLHPQRPVCGIWAGSRRCEGETGSGSGREAVGHWVCWTPKLRGPGCQSCCPGNKSKVYTTQFNMKV